MKKRILLFIALLLLTSFLLPMLVGCENMVKGKEARATFDSFFAAVVREDYEAARAYLHPCNSALDLEQIFVEVRAEYGIDLRYGTSEAPRQVGFQASIYNTEFMGSGYTMTFHAQTAASGTPIVISCTVVRNAEGYGIYSFLINRR